MGSSKRKESNEKDLKGSKGPPERISVQKQNAFNSVGQCSVQLHDGVTRSVAHHTDDDNITIRMRHHTRVRFDFFVEAGLAPLVKDVFQLIDNKRRHFVIKKHNFITKKAIKTLINCY